MINEMEYLSPYTPSRGEFGRCPRCGYKQICPCDSCLTDAVGLPKKRIVKPWKWVGDDCIECASCGFTRHVDWWLTWDMESSEGVRKFRSERSA